MPSPNPSDLRLRCPHCGRDLWHQKSGEWLFDSGVLKAAPGGLAVKCGRKGAGCGAMVPVPWIRLVDDRAQEPVQPRRVRLLVRRPLDTARLSGSG